MKLEEYHYQLLLFNTIYCPLLVQQTLQSWPDHSPQLPPGGL